MAAPYGSSFARSIVGGTALLNLMIAGLLAVFLQQSYRQYQEHAVVTAQNLSTVLKENISALVREVDVALGSEAEDLVQLHSPGSTHNAPADMLLREFQQRHPELRAVRLFDAAGRLQYGPALPANTVVTDADYFRVLRDHAGPGLALGQPRYDIPAQRWSITCARALRQTDGRFIGVLSAEVDQRRLANAFSLISVGPNGAMTLVASTEQVYARYARLRIDDGLVGRVVKSARLRDYVASGKRPPTYLFTSPFDHIERLISLQRIFDDGTLLLPANLYFSVGLSSGDYLQKWHEELWVALLIMLLTLLISSSAARLLLRFWRERIEHQGKLRALERDSVVYEERLRIVQDLHDGVGSQLLSTLMLVQSGGATQEQTAALLQECMDDMRLAIDALSPDEPDLLPVLGNFRYRMESRFKGVGLQLRWTNHDLPEALVIAPHDGLQVLRILQEALANVLRHAHARQVAVDLFFSERRLAVHIRDDGVGLGNDTQPAGHGIVNMHLRAKKIGATLLIRAAQPGTLVELEIPTA